MARPRKQPKLYVATESFQIGTDRGVDERITAGVTVVREGHPLLNGREGMFRELEVHYEVEQATANPGEARQR